MRQKRLSRLLPALLLAVLVVAGGAAAQTIPIDIELGYRWTSISGNEDMYRSQINERDGFQVRNFTLATTNFGGAAKGFDLFRIDVKDLGSGGPSGSGRFEIGLTNVYRLRASYQRREMFSALPAFANPLLSGGIIPGQHTWDRLRNVYDAELVLLPNWYVSPLFGYTQHRYTGPGTTTVTLGGDEFRLNEDLRFVEQEPRVGLLFNAAGITGHVIQGWRKSVENNVITLVPGAGAGNSSGTVLDRPVAATSYSRAADTTVNQPITNAAITAQFCPRCRITGTYIHTGGDSDANDNENATGSFVGFQIQNFFGGLSETVNSHAGNSFWRGAVRGEYGLSEDVDLIAGWRKRHRGETGNALISTLFTNVVGFTGITKSNISTLISANNRFERDDETWDVGVNVRRVGPVSFRASYEETKQDLDMTESLAEIVVSGNQDGIFERKLHTVRVGATFAMAGFTLMGDYSTSGANYAVLRTDFEDRQRTRIRGFYTFKQWFRIGGSGEWVDDDNDGAGLGYTGRYRFYSGDVEVTPWKPLSLRFQYGQIRNDTRIPIIVPTNFTTTDSVYAEKGQSYEGGVGLNLDVVQLSAMASRFENEGSFAFKIDRARVRAEVPIVPSFSLVGEWNYDKYVETVYTYGDYKAHRYGAYVRWHTN